MNSETIARECVFVFRSVCLQVFIAVYRAWRQLQEYHQAIKAMWRDLFRQCAQYDLFQIFESAEQEWNTLSLTYKLFSLDESSIIEMKH